MEQRYASNNIHPIEDLIPTSAQRKMQQSLKPEASALASDPSLLYDYALPQQKDPIASPEREHFARQPFAGGGATAKPHSQAAHASQQAHINQARGSHINPHQSKPAVGKRKPILWGVVGFILGVTFWHFIGFWSLVEKAVFNEAEIGAVHKSLDQTQLKKPVQFVKSQDALSKDASSQRPNLQANKDHVACVALVMDRKRKETFSQPCKPGVQFAEGASEIQTAARQNR